MLWRFRMHALHACKLTGRCPDARGRSYCCCCCYRGLRPTWVYGIDPGGVCWLPTAHLLSAACACRWGLARLPSIVQRAAVSCKAEPAAQQRQYRRHLRRCSRRVQRQAKESASTQSCPTNDAYSCSGIPMEGRKRVFSKRSSLRHAARASVAAPSIRRRFLAGTALEASQP